MAGGRRLNHLLRYAAAQQRQEQDFRGVLQAPLPAWAATEASGLSPEDLELFSAAATGDLAALKVSSWREGAPRSAAGLTPLYAACLNGQLAAARFLTRQDPSQVPQGSRAPRVS